MKPTIFNHYINQTQIHDSGHAIKISVTQEMGFQQSLFVFNIASRSVRPVRFLHVTLPSRRTPEPTPFVPDVKTFLQLIGRNLSQHAAKFPSWDALFTFRSQQLRDLGISVARDRRYLLRWTEKFRNGEFGVGGDFKNVVDGIAELRVVQIPAPRRRATVTDDPKTKRIVINVPKDIASAELGQEEIVPAKGYNVKGVSRMCGPHIQYVPGSQMQRAYLHAKEGLWEHRRGKKVDGGERRKAMVRAKRRAEENKNA